MVYYQYSQKMQRRIFLKAFLLKRVFHRILTWFEIKLTEGSHTNRSQKTSKCGTVHQWHTHQHCANIFVIYLTSNEFAGQYFAGFYFQDFNRQIWKKALNFALLAFSTSFQFLKSMIFLKHFQLNSSNVWTISTDDTKGTYQKQFVY